MSIAHATPDKATKAKKQLNWSPVHTLEETIQTAWEWHKK